MKLYDIPIVWSSYKRYRVEAVNLEEAVKAAMKQFLSEPDDNYLSDSVMVDEIINEEHPDEMVDLDELVNKIP